MKFGRVANISDLDSIQFELGSDTRITNKVLSQDPSNELNVFIGSPAWGIKEWRGSVYPKEAKTEQLLHYYSKIYKSIELNATHYGFPTEKNIEKWREQVVTNFKFCPKVPQSISHFGGLTDKEKVETFFKVISLFKEKLGPIFLQLHQNFSPAKINDLNRFISLIPQNVEVAIEVRHKDWYLNQSIFECFALNKISTVITDTAGEREILQMNVTSTTAFVRFVGNNLHKTDFKRLDDWVIRIKSWKEKGLKDLYFFIHQPDEIVFPETAEYFLQTLNNAGINMNIPKLDTISLF